MDFVKFVAVTLPILGGKSNVQTHVKTLFETILTENGEEILKGYSDSTFKAYANGSTKINRIARAMTQYLDPDAFSSFIMETEYPVKKALCDSFAKELPNIKIDNVGDEIADLFAKIIKEAAAVKRAPKKSKIHNSQQGATSKVKWGKIEISKEESDLLKQFKQAFDKIMQDCINTDFTLGFRLELADEIRLTLNYWNYKYLTFKTSTLRKTIIDVYNSLSELSGLISDPINYWDYNDETDLVQPSPPQFSKENEQEYTEYHDWLYEKLRPISMKLRYELRDLYRTLHPEDFKDLPPYPDSYEDWLKENMT